MILNNKEYQKANIRGSLNLDIIAFDNDIGVLPLLL